MCVRTGLCIQAGEGLEARELEPSELLIPLRRSFSSVPFLGYWKEVANSVT
jgi:hypothetical protein